MVTAGDHRRGGAAPERAERRGKRKGRSTAHPGTTRVAETTAGVKKRGGAVRDDEGDGAPAVGGRSEGADGVGDNAAKPMEVAPSREGARSDVGGVPEVGGDGGERGGRREHESDGESKRRMVETEEGGTGSKYIAPRGGERDRRGRKRPRRSRATLKTLGDDCGIQIGRIRGRERGKRGGNGRGNHGE
jgi:Domain of unknown function (DUF834).